MNRVETGKEIDVASLAALASGRTDPAVAMLVETALDMRGRAEPAAEAISGAFLEVEAPVETSPEALARVMAVIDADTPVVPRGGSRPADRSEIRVPARLMQAIDAAERARGWRAVGPGIRVLSLDIPGPARSEIIRIDAGGAVPRHTHVGGELTLCLAGGFSDEGGAYGPGDVVYADAKVTHRPVADADGPCYVMAVTDAGLRLTGLLGVLQRLVGG